MNTRKDAPKKGAGDKKTFKTPFNKFVKKAKEGSGTKKAAEYTPDTYDSPKKPGARGAKPTGKGTKPGSRADKAFGRGAKPTSRTDRPVTRTEKPNSRPENPAAEGADQTVKKTRVNPKFNNKFKERKGDPMPKFNDDGQRLNKFLSNAGVASRRESDVLITTGVITVNDVIVQELGFKIKPGDVVKFEGETINAEKKRYVLLNKPKGFITTMDDPLGRKTVMYLVRNACRERIYPVGRLDRETTGLLLFTNDGDLAKKLTHPQYKASKIYHVELNKNVTLEDVNKLRKGIFLDDGPIQCDDVQYISEHSAKEIGVEIHSGKNRVVRRMFESLGYNVLKLDRVQFSGLTKKDLPRGYFRHLTEKELAFLKMS